MKRRLALNIVSHFVVPTYIQPSKTIAGVSKFLICNEFLREWKKTEHSRCQNPIFVTIAGDLESTEYSGDQKRSGAVTKQ